MFHKTKTEGVCRILAIDIDGIIRDLEAPYLCLTGDETLNRYDHPGWTEWFYGLSEDNMWDLMTNAPVIRSGLELYRKLASISFFDALFFLTAQGKNCEYPTRDFMRDNVFDENMIVLSEYDGQLPDVLGSNIPRIVDGCVDVALVAKSSYKACLLRAVANEACIQYGLSPEKVKVGLIDDCLRTQKSLDSNMLKFFATQRLTRDAFEIRGTDILDISKVVFSNDTNMQNELIYKEIIKPFGG